MKLRNGKNTEKYRVRIKEEFNTKHCFYIDKEQNKEYFSISRTIYKTNLIFKKEILKKFKEEFDSIE